MKNFVDSGDLLTVTASGSVASGDGVVVGTTFGIAATSAASGEKYELKRSGRYTLPCATGVTASQGANAYWLADDSGVTSSSSGNTLIGFFALPKVAGELAADVTLRP